MTRNDGDTLLGEWLETTEREFDGLDLNEMWRFVAMFEDEDAYDVTGYSISVDGDVQNREGDGAGNS